MSISNRMDRVSEKIEQLLLREEQYEIFLNASPWGILVVDKTFHIIFVNKRLEVMSGYTSDELVGMHMHILLPPEDIPVHIKHEKAYIKNPADRTGNHGLHPQIYTKYNQRVPVEVSLSPTQVQGERFFFASIRPLETLFDTIEGIVK